MKMFAYLFMLFIMTAAVLALDDACTKRGFNYMVAEWARDNVTDTFNVVNESAGMSTIVLGNGSRVDWISNIFVDAIVSKEGKTVYQLLPGGSDGSFDKKGNVDINFVYFCRNESLSDGNNDDNSTDDGDSGAGDTNEVPEFGLITAGAAMLGALGILAFRRRK